MPKVIKSHSDKSKYYYNIDVTDIKHFFDFIEIVFIKKTTLKYFMDSENQSIG